MKCPIDQTEMEEASIWTNNINAIQSVSGLVNEAYIWLGDPKTGKKEERMRSLNVWVCPKCGKVELHAEIKDGK